MEVRVLKKAAAWTLVTLAVMACIGFSFLPSVLFFVPERSDDRALIRSKKCSGELLSNASSPYIPFVRAFQSCLWHRNNNDTLIAHMTGNEGDSILFLLLSLPGMDDACRLSVVPFLCLNIFPLCDGTGQLFLPSYESCVDLRHGACATWWDSAIATGLVPRCDDFPRDPRYLQCASTNTTNSWSAIKLLVEDEPPTNCTKHFYLFNDTCRPRCDSWETDRGVRLKVTCIIVVTIGLLGEIAMLTAIAVQWKSMFTFPKVIIVYMTIDLVIITLLLLVNYLDRKTLFCTSPDLLKSLEHKSVFCDLSGAVFLYLNLHLPLLWLCHVSIMFVKLKWPFRARSLELSGHCRRMHVSLLVVFLVIPAAPVVATFSTGGFVPFIYPPLLCTPRVGKVTYYSIILPINVILALGAVLLVSVIWIVRKHHGLIMAKSVQQSQQPSISTAERKLLLSFIYYGVLGVVATVSMSISSRNRETLIRKLELYFICRASGKISDSVCQPFEHEVDTVMNTELIASGLGLLMLFPLIHLTYVVNFKGLLTIVKYFKPKVPSGEKHVPQEGLGLEEHACARDRFNDVYRPTTDVL